MTYQESITSLISNAAETVIRNVVAMPEGQLMFTPEAEKVRTPLALLEEILSTTRWTAGVLATQGLVDLEEVPSITAANLEDFAVNLRKAVSDLNESISAFPEDKLNDTLDLPWATMSFMDIIAYPYWNMMYHYGQIAYVQMMHGDMQMH